MIPGDEVIRYRDHSRKRASGSVLIFQSPPRKYAVLCRSTKMEFTPLLAIELLAAFAALVASYLGKRLFRSMAPIPKSQAISR